MIKKLQKRFVMIVMVSFLPVIIIIVTAINIINVASEEHRIDSMLDTLTSSVRVAFFDGRELFGGSGFYGGGEFPEDPLFSLNLSTDVQSGFRNGETVFNRFFIVEITDNDTIASILLDNTTNVEDQSITSAAASIIQKGEDNGKEGNYAYRIIQVGSSTLLVMLDTSSSQSAITSVFIISLVTGVTAYLLVFVVIILSSRRAVQPFIKNYEKQKQFVTNVGHELKTPLTVISANNEILAHTYGNNEWSDGIARQTERMQNLIKQMISLAKTEEEDSLDMQQFSLSDAVFDTTHAYKNIISSADKDFESSIAPDVMIYGDEAAIRQLVSILLDNALKYCDEGGTVAVILLGGRRPSLAVTNTYSKAEELDYSCIFDRFYRADKARSSKGFGLGLSIAQSTVEKHGGAITASSLDATTVEFSIVFPKQQ